MRLSAAKRPPTVATSLTSTYAYVNPVIAVLLGWAILGERIAGMTVLAAALIVGAVTLIVLGQRARAPAMRTPARRVDGVMPIQASPADAPAVQDEAAT